MLGRIVIGIAVLAVVLLDFAALDDITTGNEPNFHAERSMLTFSLVLFAALGWSLVLKRGRARNSNT